MHLVFSWLEYVSFGHWVQISDPLCGLTEPGRQGTHCQQHGDVIDVLVPAAHWSTHSDLGVNEVPVAEFQSTFSWKLNRFLFCSSASHLPTTTCFSRFTWDFCSCWKLTMWNTVAAGSPCWSNVIFPVSPLKLTFGKNLWTSLLFTLQVCCWQ